MRSKLRRELIQSQSNPYIKIILITPFPHIRKNYSVRQFLLEKLTADKLMAVWNIIIFRRGKTCPSTQESYLYLCLINYQIIYNHFKSMYAQPYGAPPPQPYGAPAPYGYAQPPPPPPAYYPAPQQQGPMIINLGNNNNASGSPCGICGKDTESIPRKKIGCVAWAWCICLLFTFGGWGLCFVPLCSDSCKDTELVCIKCQNVKQTIHANCC